MDNNYLLHKYLNDEASAQEIIELKASSEYAAYVKIADASMGFEVPAHDSEANLDGIFSKIETQPKRKINWKIRGLKIAALLVALLASYIFINNLDTTITTEIAQQELITLPNNSEVQLNANSSLTYNKNNWKNNRSIALDGEAYFKVTKGQSFQVTTSQGTVTVLGTEFNVFARDNIFHIECFEGLVEVAFKEGLLQLPAGNKIQIENGRISLNETTVKLAPSWIYEESSFSDVSLATVLNEIENQYDVKVIYSEEEGTRRFSGTFTHNDIDIALKSICTPLRLQFVKKGNEVTIYDQNSR